MVDAKELRRLMSEATSGPWIVDSTAALGAYGIWTDGTYLPDEKSMKQICSMQPMERILEAERRSADAALIVAAVNSLPELLSRLEELQAKCERLERELATAMALLDRVADVSETAPDPQWFRDYFALTGAHMILTEEGWEPAEHKSQYLADDPKWEPLDEVGA